MLLLSYDLGYFNIHRIPYWPILDTSAQTRPSGNETANERWMVEIIADSRVLTNVLLSYLPMQGFAQVLALLLLP